MPNIKLRQDTVKSLPYLGTVKQEQCIYWDLALECFGLRIYPSGRRVYVCSYRLQKRKRVACLGRGDVLTLDQARKRSIKPGEFQGSRISPISFVAARLGNILRGSANHCEES